VPLGTDYLYWTISGSLYYNALNSNVKDRIEEYFNKLIEGYADITFPKYLSVPLLTGLHLEGRVAESIALFGEASAGLGILNVTDFNADYYGSSSTRYYSEIMFYTGTAFAYNLGGGLVINDRYVVGLHYMNLGTFRLKYEYTEQGSTPKREKLRRLPVSDVGITLGYRF